MKLCGRKLRMKESSVFAAASKFHAWAWMRLSLVSKDLQFCAPSAPCLHFLAERDLWRTRASLRLQNRRQIPFSSLRPKLEKLGWVAYKHLF